MKLFILLSLFLSQFALAGNVPVPGNVYQLGGNGGSFPSVVVPYTDRSVFALTGGCQGGAAGSFLSLGKANNPSPTNAIYQVSAGKTFRAIGMYWQTTNGSTAAHMQFGYATAAFANAQTGAPTGAVYYSPTGTNNTPNGGITAPAGGPASGETWIPLNMDFPALSYPFWGVDESIGCWARVYGYEY